MNIYKQESKPKNFDLLVGDAINKLTKLSDVNLIVGKKIQLEDGVSVIPVSKVSIGFLSGGGEYGEVKLFQNKDALPHSAASGGVLSVKPSGFIINKKGAIKYIHCPNDVFEKAFDTCEELIKSINEKISKS